MGKQDNTLNLQVVYVSSNMSVSVIIKVINFFNVIKVMLEHINVNLTVAKLRSVKHIKPAESLTVNYKSK